MGDVPDANPVARSREAAPVSSAIRPTPGEPISRDIREYLGEREQRDLLIRVDRLTNKDTEVILDQYPYRSPALRAMALRRSAP